MSAEAEFTTYRMANGEHVFDEFAFVTNLEWLTDTEEPVTLIKETWTLRDREEIVVMPAPADGGAP